MRSTFKVNTWFSWGFKDTQYVCIIRYVLQDNSVMAKTSKQTCYNVSVFLFWFKMYAVYLNINYDRLIESGSWRSSRQLLKEHGQLLWGTGCRRTFFNYYTSCWETDVTDAEWPHGIENVWARCCTNVTCQCEHTAMYIYNNLLNRCMSYDFACLIL